MIFNQNPNLRTEDFPSEQAWISRLFVQLNPFIQSVYQLFNGNIDFSTNIQSVTRDYEITTFQEFSFVWPYLNSVPNSVIVTKATSGNQKTPTILLLGWSYDPNSKAITIKKMIEVNETSVNPLSGRYNFTIRATV